MSYLSLTQISEVFASRGISFGQDDIELLRKDGYFHGYKQHRFYKEVDNVLPFSSYSEVHATIEYDAHLREIFFGRVSLVEVAIKNIALEEIIAFSGSGRLSDFFAHAVMGLDEDGDSVSKKKKTGLEKERVGMMICIHTSILNAAKEGRREILQFYEKGESEIPLWAYFEIMSMGDLARIVSNLKPQLRENISKKIGLNLSYDTNRDLLCECVYILRDLRNAIAHNMPIFDARFRKAKVSKALEANVVSMFDISNFKMDAIADYLVLTCCLLQLLSFPASEIRRFIDDFWTEMLAYQGKVPDRLFKKAIESKNQQQTVMLKSFF